LRDHTPKFRGGKNLHTSIARPTEVGDATNLACEFAERRLGAWSGELERLEEWVCDLMPDALTGDTYAALQVSDLVDEKTILMGLAPALPSRGMG
jgi:hypothetical protein